MRSLLIEEVVVDLEIAIVGRGAFGPWWFNGDLQWYKVKHHLINYKFKHFGVSQN